MSNVEGSTARHIAAIRTSDDCSLSGLAVPFFVAVRPRGATTSLRPTVALLVSGSLSFFLFQISFRCEL